MVQLGTSKLINSKVPWLVEFLFLGCPKNASNYPKNPISKIHTNPISSIKITNDVIQSGKNPASIQTASISTSNKAIKI
jgi:hypothetical protein